MALSSLDITETLILPKCSTCPKNYGAYMMFDEKHGFKIFVDGEAFIPTESSSYEEFQVNEPKMKSIQKAPSITSISSIYDSTTLINFDHIAYYYVTNEQVQLKLNYFVTEKFFELISEIKKLIDILFKGNVNHIIVDALNESNVEKILPILRTSYTKQRIWLGVQNQININKK